MTKFEYKVLPAPSTATKVKGIKSTEGRFAHALMEVMNDLGEDGWEYLRADTLPCEERSGLTGKTTKFQNMLIFRRPLSEIVESGEVIPFAAPEESEDHLHGDATDRIASTLTAQPVEGTTPKLHTVVETGSAPKLGSAENGPSHSQDTNVAAE